MGGGGGGGILNAGGAVCLCAGMGGGGGILNAGTEGRDARSSAAIFANSRIASFSGNRKNSRLLWTRKGFRRS